MRNLIPSYIRVPIVFFIILGLVEYFVDSGDQPAFIKYPVILLFLLLVLLILVAIEAIIGALENVMFQSLTEEAKERFLASKTKVPQFTWIKNTYKKLAGTKPIETESELILDHNYDGIKELDNSLPPWWIYSFYASIVFAAVYLVNVHILGNNSQFDEYAEEYKQAEISIAEYKKNAKDLVDINTVTQLTDAADLSAGKAIFMQNCVACHMADGGGGIGPNLTDKHWILGGGIKNVFHTITEGGRDGKGMIAWKQNFKPSEIAQVASYVLSLQGTTPANPKEPQGDIIWPDETEETPAVDETKTTEVDSLSTMAATK
ncbi:cbb3-type cytochrome c oxidase N-terminal domain-containing protein [Yeosuana marina]|uniref:cbb3-type cytochrome c oxidase N-terminal domain-containing protein n=1 Tax=Yeosuana marina TaxID=1565536 RepID=UPI00141DEDD8|nr:cbb3-type cytochrome c oxidase N-terminal domain-containing protein [Yeosuana marina]